MRLLRRPITITQPGEAGASDTFAGRWGESDTHGHGASAPLEGGNVLLPQFMQLRPTEPGHSPGVAAVVGDEIGGLHGSARGDWWILPSESWNVPSP